MEGRGAGDGQASATGANAGGGGLEFAAGQDQFAPFVALPSSLRLQSVQLPAFVASADEAAQHMPNLEKALSSQSSTLTLRLRKDPLTRPLFGNTTTTSELLVKVTKRVSRKTGQVLDTHVAPIGIVDSTWSFDSLADFQMTDARPLSKRPRIGMTEDPQSFIERVGRDEPLLLVPPQFSSLNRPLDYRFHAGKAAVVKEIKRGTKHVMAWDESTPPKTPMQVPLDPKVARVWEARVRRMFEEVRPVWMLDRLMVALWREDPTGEVPSVRLMKKVLPYIAGNYKTGPFRKAWVRYGYDVIVDPNARFYQVMDFRLPDGADKDHFDSIQVTAAPVYPVSQTLHAERNKKEVNALDGTAAVDADGEPTSPAKKIKKAEPKHKRGEVEDPDAMFDKLEQQMCFIAYPTQQQTLLQMCDINCDAVREIVFSRRNQRFFLPPMLTHKTGWYTDDVLKEMRDAMRSQLRTMAKPVYDPRSATVVPVPNYRELLLQIDNYDIYNPPLPDDADFAPAPLAPPPKPVERKRGRPRKERVPEYAKPMEELLAKRAAMLQAAAAGGQRVPPKDKEEDE